MVFLKKGFFFHLLILGNIGQENEFYDILEERNTFLGYKNNEDEKLEKLRFFQRGLVHGFGQKWAIFSSFYFRQYRAGK